MANGVFLFIDLNSYFATAEQQANPTLRGKPVGVCEHSGGIILAPSREAKLLGIKTGTPTWEAKKICPNIILLPVDPSKIRALTSRFYRIAEDYSQDIEHVSVDEVSVYLEPCTYGQAVEIARDIKQRIKKEMGEWMTASMGIAENRLLAKIGTNLQKPEGLGVIYDQARSPVVNAERSTTRADSTLNGAKIFYKADLYNILELEDIPGIGPRLARRLRLQGINTLKQLSLVPMDQLHAWWGMTGVWLHDLANFIDAWRYIDLDDRAVKSIGHQYALGKRKALHDFKKIYGLFWKLTEKVTARMRKAGLAGDTVSAYLGFVNGGGIGGSHRANDFFDDTPTVVKVAQRWLSQLSSQPWQRTWGQTSNQEEGLTPRGITFVSITVSGLREKQAQGVLFEKYKRSEKVSQAIDAVNKRFGDFSISYAPTVEVKGVAGDTVGFGRTRERQDWREE